MRPHVIRRVLACLLAMGMTSLASAEIYLVKDLDKQPKQKTIPAPKYPHELRVNGVMGVAVVRSYVNAAGQVEKSEVVGQSDIAFGKAAYESVSRWQYFPATKNGTPVGFVVQVPVFFSLEGESVKDLDKRIFGFPAKPPEKLPSDYQYDEAPAPEDNPRPIYPYEQWLNQVTGNANVAYAVDETGRVIDIKIWEASEPVFGYALAAAVQGWHFKPATLHGKPAKAIGRFTANFDLYQPPGESDIRLLGLIRKGQKFSSAGELDAALTPEHQVSPNYPLALASEGLAGETVIEVIIDRDGWVRLPKIISATKAEFGWSAATAVRQWRFAPPRKGGQPVDVRVRVPFGFKAPTS